MPLTRWTTPQYAGHDVLELTTVKPKPDHPDESIRQHPEHVLMLLREEWHPGKFAWGLAWLVYNTESGQWGQRLFASGPSPTGGDSERKMLRSFKEDITGVMAG